MICSSNASLINDINGRSHQRDLKVLCSFKCDEWWVRCQEYNGDKKIASESFRMISLIFAEFLPSCITTSISPRVSQVILRLCPFSPLNNHRVSKLLCRYTCKAVNKLFSDRISGTLITLCKLDARGLLSFQTIPVLQSWSSFLRSVIQA